MRQEMTGFWDGSGISWTICKQSAPRSRQQHLITQFLQARCSSWRPVVYSHIHTRTNARTHTHTRLTALPIWILLKQETVSGSGISRAYASLHLAPDRQPCQHLTTQFFTGRMLFLPPNQQCQSTEGTSSSSIALYVNNLHNNNNK